MQPVNSIYAAYLLARSNALWFATKSDGYRSGRNEQHFDVPSGVCLHTSQCAYRDACKFWKLLSEQERERLQTHGKPLGPLARIKGQTQCRCLACLKKLLTALYASRSEQVVVDSLEEET